MATIIRMPEVLANSTEAAIQTWLVTLGQTISVGTPLAEVETEKATVEYAAEAEGTVLQLLAGEGVSVRVGDPIAIIGAPGESVDALEPGQPGPAVEAEPAPKPVPSGPSDPGRAFISPLVRRLARERQLDLAGIVGSGPGGRIVRRDIDGRVATVVPPAVAPVAAPVVTEQAGDFEDVAHTGMRRAIARRLTESTSTIPHFYLVADCRVDELLALRKRINEQSPVKVSVNDFVVKAVAAALRDVPEANAIWQPDATRRFSAVDLSIAVSVAGGLLTPVIRNVNALSLTEISGTIAELAARARDGGLKQHELEGGSFSVSNLGMFGTTEFSAIINPPQSGILAVGAATQRPVVTDGELGVATVMTVTLSADHRVLDGAFAAQWLAAFVTRIENPLSMLV